MDNFKEAKQNKVEMHEKQLEEYEKHAEDLANKREHSDRMYEFLRSQVRDESDKMMLDTARDDSDIRFQEAFREQVEAPTTEIKKELDEDADELFAENRSIIGAVEQVDATGVDDDVKSKVKTELGKSANEYAAMGQAARDIIAKSDEKINASRIRVLGMYK